MLAEKRGFLYVLAALLAVLNVAVWLLGDFSPPADSHAPGPIPLRIGSWQGADVPLTHYEREVLAPATLISRTYHDQSRQDARARQWEVIWLNVIQSRTIGSLHNVYDSLVASGSRPLIIGERRIQTRKGPLQASLIRYTNTREQPGYLLLWYQWPGGNAPNRWQWYLDILRMRLSRQPPPGWQLVEASTTLLHPEDSLTASRDLGRLEEFACRLYEQTL